MAWQRLKHAEITGSAGVLDSGTFTAYKHLRVIIFGNVVSGTMAITFNGVTPEDSRYPYKTGDDGATKTGASGQPAIPVTDNANTSYVIAEIWNVAGEEKQIIARSISSSTGAGTAPDRREILAKWTETTNQITSVKITNNSGGSLNCAVGSYITVLGEVGDIPTTDEKTTLTNVPVGTRFEAIDTKKFYRWAENSASSSNMEDSGSWSGDGSLSVASGEIQVRLGGSNAGRAKLDYGTSNINASKWIMRFKWEQNGTQTLSSPNDMRCIIGLSSSDGSFGGNSPTYGTTTQDCVGMYMDVGHVHLVGMNNSASPSTQATADSLLDYDHTGSAFTKYVEIIRNGDSFTLNIYPNSDFTGTVITSTKTISNIGSLRYVGSQAGWYGGGGGINADISDITFYNGVTSVNEWKVRGSA